MDGSGTLACSGGKDDQGLVWKIADGSIAFKCQGERGKNGTTDLQISLPVSSSLPAHKDSVTCTGFSHDSKYVATADMAGLIQVWACSSGALVWSFEIGDIEVPL